MIDLLLERLPERIRSKILLDEETGCWLWQGYTDDHGYGGMSRKTYGSSLAHVAVYFLVRGIAALPASHELHHECERPSRCAPHHLTVLPHDEHMRRHGNKLTHCPAGHEYAKHARKRARGRDCAICHADRERERSRRNREVRNAA